MEKQERWTPLQAWDKMTGWCAYTERCHSDARRHMLERSLTMQEADMIISRLIEENFLNEERFATAFARGHFRMKSWGKKKISYALRIKQVSDYCIRKGLQAIDDDEYMAVLAKLAQNRWQSIGKATPAQRWAKTRNYLLQKGFESDLVQDQLKQLQNKTP